MRPALLAAAFVPPAVAGLTLERRIEERLGTPVTLAAGLLAGGAALVLADRTPATRSAAGVQIADGVVLGFAQAAALVPGVSRNGATLAAARARGFGRPDASRLSWEVALPVLLGANALKAVRVAQAASARPDPIAPRIAPLALGAGAALASTLATARAIGIERHSPLWPWAVWRAALAGAILAVRQNRAR
jgi:undecaprenyl-diphosphatase